MNIKSTAFSPVEAPKGWYATADSQSDAYPLIERALALQGEALAKGYYCICGLMEDGGYRLYLAPAIGVKSILEPFQIGAHGGDAIESVFAQISDADIMNPLIPYFADPAGLKAKFSKPITNQLIELLEETVLDAEIMMDDEDGTIGEFVRTNKEIQLWWD
jgi:hypothetical protein